jgi:hypothetical protein
VNNQPTPTPAPANDAAEWISVTAKEIARRFYGYFKGGSAGPGDALQYWDGSGRHSPEAKYIINFCQDIIARHAPASPAVAGEAESRDKADTKESSSIGELIAKVRSMRIQLTAQQAKIELLKNALRHYEHVISEGGHMWAKAALSSARE